MTTKLFSLLISLKMLNVSEGKLCHFYEKDLNNVLSLTRKSTHFMRNERRLINNWNKQITKFHKKPNKTEISLISLVYERIIEFMLRYGFVIVETSYGLERIIGTFPYVSQCHNNLYDSSILRYSNTLNH